MTKTSRAIRTYTKAERKVFDTLCKSIEARLKEIGKNKIWLASKLGIATNRLSMILKNQSRGEIWNILELQKLAVALQCSVVFNQKQKISLQYAPKDTSDENL